MLLADFNGDGFVDGAFGSGSEDLNTSTGREDNAGMVNVLPGAIEGLTSDNSSHWHQDRPGIAGAAEQGDFFGAAMPA